MLIIADVWRPLRDGASGVPKNPLGLEQPGIRSNGPSCGETPSSAIITALDSIMGSVLKKKKKRRGKLRRKRRHQIRKNSHSK